MPVGYRNGFVDAIVAQGLSDFGRELPGLIFCGVICEPPLDHNCDRVHAHERAVREHDHAARADVRAGLADRRPDHGDALTRCRDHGRQRAGRLCDRPEEQRETFEYLKRALNEERAAGGERLLFVDDDELDRFARFRPIGFSE